MSDIASVASSVGLLDSNRTLPSSGVIGNPLHFFADEEEPAGVSCLVVRGKTKFCLSFDQYRQKYCN